MFGEDDIVKSHKARADIISNIVIVSFAIILARLWYLQIYQGKKLHRYSIENRLRKTVVKAPRGMVFSRNNQLLIHNTPRFDVVVVPQYLKNKKKTLKKLSMIVGVDLKKISAILNKNSFQARYRPVTIKKNISRREVAIIETESSKLPGINVHTFISREYTDKEVGGHSLGYISEISQEQLPKYRKRDQYNYKLGDFIGQAGLEEKLDLELRGEDGFLYMEVDARGRMKRQADMDTLFQGIHSKQASPGKNIRLTLDRDLQISAYEALEGKVGSAVAVDVSSGEILAMISRPSFDPSKFSRGLTQNYWGELVGDTRHPLRDRSIQEHYAPGSTYKAFTAIAALEEGVVDEKTEVVCKGSFKLGRRPFHCWKRGGHGRVDVVKALRESCDVYFYKIALKLDIDVLARYANLYGYGRKTGVNLPRETTGLIPTKEWKKKRNGADWQLGETLSCAIGQSYNLVTPLQMAMSYAALANGGTLHRPYLVKEVFSNDGTVLRKNATQVVSRIQISKKTMDLVKKGLFEVVNVRKGTAWWHRGKGIRMSGKTGTSQVIRFSADKIYEKCDKREYKFRHHGIFVGYAPEDKPKIAVAAVVEHGCSGSSAAAPVVKSVITTYMEKYFPNLRKKYLSEDLKKLREMERKRKLESSLSKTKRDEG